MLQTIGAFLQLLLLILSKWAEKDAAKKSKKEEIQKELSDALKAKDTSAITAALDHLHGM
jgi:hypothetical protein